MPGALDGIRILEFSEMIAAPFAGMLLADMGADVIKVEPPEGESWRLFAQFVPKESRAFMAVNRGKRGIAIDLKSPEGQEIVHRLVPDMDVVIVNYRPDTPPRLGIDYERLRALNPSLIYVQNTALGLRGPSAHRPGYDLVAQAVTGLMATDGKLDEEGIPHPANPAVADFATGLAIAFATSAALFERERTGLGQKVDSSLMATALAMQGTSVLRVEAPERPEADDVASRIRRARESGATWDEIQAVRSERAPSVAGAYYRCYVTKDSLVAIACLTPALRRKFTNAVGVEDPRQADRSLARTGPDGRAIAEKFARAVEARMRERTTDEWLAAFDAGGVPAGPFRFAWELSDDPQVLANDLLVDLEHAVLGPITMAGPIVEMSRTPARASSASPALGQHTDEILTALGYDGERIARLRERGVVG